MKKRVLLTLLICLFGSPLSADEGYYELVAVKYYDTYYAEWGTVNDEYYEDRYDGMEFEVRENGKKIGSVVVFQHWFKKDRKPYPMIGDIIRTERFDYLSSEIPGEGGNIEFDNLKIIKP